MPNWIIGLLSGAIGSCAVALAGWKESEEPFSWKRFLTTVIPSIIIGGVAGLMNMDYAIISNGAIGVGITQIIKKLVKLY